MKVSDQSKKELYEVLSMYYDSIFETALENYQRDKNADKVYQIL
jgi:hypothetical protein